MLRMGEDPTLSRKARTLAGVPLLFIANNAICLEKPTDKSKARAKKLLNEKLLPSHEREKLKEGSADEEEPKKKKKKIKGPNPLSCKKKKKTPALHGVQHSEISDGAKKRARKRRRRGKDEADLPDEEKQRLMKLDFILYESAALMKVEISSY
nr:hypothetical protein BaRGS_020352 [Batillaria attramentaria]